MQNPLRALTFALEKYPEKVAMIPIQELALERARKNDKRDAWVKLAVPDEIVKGLRGSRAEEGDLVMLVVVPKEVSERSESRIILPGEVR
ncbi:MAG TPA: hypothetical protein VH988_02240 [Thermoanaerobaculia bacterium]|jgi:hypothetical protein|nr:hypothetical protein [Thermoanaerobaculia bacterium]